MKKFMRFTAIAIFAWIIIALTTTAEANYQSVYQEANNYLKTNLPNWISGIRNMEASGQVFGLKETKDGTTLMPTTSNNIDVHLQKNTEYGTMILLSASPEYGKQGTGTARYIANGSGMATTTGNVYGVYMNDIQSYNVEYVAAHVNTFGNTAINSNINGRYLNRYETAETRKNGDAILNWHGNTTSSLSSSYVLHRGYNNMVYYTNYASGGNNYYARAVIVNGKNF